MSRGQMAALRQIRPAQRAYNHDRSWVLGWWVARHDEDRWDEVTEYRIALFDARTEEQLTFWVTSIHERADTGAKEGQHLASAAFDSADELTIVLRYTDGSEQRLRVDEDYEVLDRNPEDYGVEMSDAERRLREGLRQEAAELAAKLKRKP